MKMLKIVLRKEDVENIPFLEENIEAHEKYSKSLLSQFDGKFKVVWSTGNSKLMDVKDGKFEVYGNEY